MTLFRHPPANRGIQAMKDDERHLFRDFVGEVEPVKSERKAQKPRTEETPGMKMRRLAAQARGDRHRDYLDREEFIQPVKPWDELSWKRDGVQHGVFRNLRQGKYTIDARLDLHRQTVEQARHSVLRFVHDCVDHDARSVLITHGRGEGREKPALLKSCVNHWLRQLNQVLAFHSAQHHHGGSGATYVLLRKSDKKREENRERFS